MVVGWCSIVADYAAGNVLEELLPMEIMVELVESRFDGWCGQMACFDWAENHGWEDDV